MTTAAAFAPMAPLSFVTAETAFAAYQLACATGEAEAFATAAHALAFALKAERARRMAPRPGATTGPRLVVDNDPKPEAARSPAKSSRKAARVAEDLDARLPAPKRGWPAGSFVVEWADGTSTRVQGVAWAAAKPATRWARAYQSANRVRRIRHGREIEAGLGGASAIAGRFSTLTGGITVDSPQWRDLLATTPLPALAAVVDETTGERFEAPAGSRYGAGDADRAREVEAAICLPRLPWLAAAAARSNPLFGVRTGEPVTYLIDRDAASAEDLPIRHAVAFASPWPDAWRRQMIRDAEAAFSPAEEIVPHVPPVAGDGVEATTADDVDGLTVTTTAEGLEAADAAVGRARSAYEAARKAADPAKGTPREVIDASAALNAAEELRTSLGRVIRHAWTAHRAPGGAVKLTRPGHGVVMSTACLPYLHRVA